MVRRVGMTVGLRQVVDNSANAVRAGQLLDVFADTTSALHKRKIAIDGDDDEECIDFLGVFNRGQDSSGTNAIVDDDEEEQANSPPKKANKKAATKPIVLMDYTFISGRSETELYTILNAIDVALAQIYPMAVDAKGAVDYVIKCVAEQLDRCGRKELILRVDGEPAILKLAQAIQAFRKARNGLTVIEVKPRFIPASMGAVENANNEVKNLIRCWVLMLSEKAGVAVGPSDPLLAWLVRHVGWLITTFQVRDDGRTGYERLKGRPYTGQITMFGE